MTGLSFSRFCLGAYKGLFLDRPDGPWHRSEGWAYPTGRRNNCEFDGQLTCHNKDLTPMTEKKRILEKAA